MTRCCHCRRAPRLPYSGYCRVCYNAHMRWYYHRRHRSPLPLVERYRQAFLSLADRTPVPHVPLGWRWCSFHGTTHPVQAFSKNCTGPEGLERYCREGRKAWQAQRGEQRA